MTHATYEAPKLTVLGTVSELTEQKSGGQPDNPSVDGGGSFTPSISDVRLKREIRAL